jgi:Flp pilus assembly protein TadG
MFVRRRIHKATQERSGAALVETALVLPIFFMVVLGIIEFGRAMMVAQLLNNGAHEGARLAMMSGTTNTEVETTVKNVISNTVGVAVDKITVTITVTPAPGNPDPANQVINAKRRDLCNVQARVNFGDVDYIPAKFLATSQLTGQAAMRHE